jgi:hypothetical protein
MKRTFTIAAMVLMCLNAFAQTDLSYKKWEDGKLAIEDFNRRTADDDNICVIHTGIDTYSGDWEKVKWNLRVKRLKSTTLFDPIQSWITKDDSLSSQALRYAQLVFDVTEVTRRKMQNHLYSGNNDQTSEFTVGRYFDILTAQSAEISRITDKGKNLAEIEAQEKIVAEELASVNETFTELPPYTLNKFGVGFHGGATSRIHVGESAQIFSPSFGFLMGMSYTFGRSEIYIDLNFGGGCRLLDDVKLGDLETWKAGNKVSYINGDFVYAYSVYDGNTFKISPFAVFGANNVYYRNPNVESDDKNNEYIGLTLLAGLSFDLKFLNSLFLAGDPVRSSINGGINEHSFKLRVYAERTGFGNGFAPYSINCSLCYNILSKSMKR